MPMHLVGVPDKYEDVVEGVVVFTRESVYPVRVANLTPRLSSPEPHLVFVFRDGHLEPAPTVNLSPR